MKSVLASLSDSGFIASVEAGIDWACQGMTSLVEWNEEQAKGLGDRKVDVESYGRGQRKPPPMAADG